MSDEKTSLVVCVLALTHDERDQVPKRFRNGLESAADRYDIMTDGRVYSGSRDDWSPFVDHCRILSYLKDAEFKNIPTTSLLAQLKEVKTRQEMLKKTKLYIIDPVFLTLEGFQDFVKELNGAIGAKADIYYCIIIPDRMPGDLRNLLSELCEKKLPLLQPVNIRDARLAGWNIESSTRLKAFLTVLHKLLQLDNLYDSNGTPKIQFGMPGFGAQP